MAHAKTVNIIKPTDYERFNNLYAFSHTGTGRRGAVSEPLMYTAACYGLSNGTGKVNIQKTKYACGKCLISPRYTNSKGTCWRGCSS